MLALPLAGSALILTRPWHGHTRCPKVARHVMSYGDQVLQVTDPDDFRVAIYKGRSVRNASAYDAQIRAIAEDFLQTGSRSISAALRSTGDMPLVLRVCGFRALASPMRVWMGGWACLRLKVGVCTVRLVDFGAKTVALCSVACTTFDRRLCRL